MGQETKAIALLRPGTGVSRPAPRLTTIWLTNGPLRDQCRSAGPHYFSRSVKTSERAVENLAVIFLNPGVVGCNSSLHSLSARVFWVRTCLHFGKICSILRS